MRYAIAKLVNVEQQLETAKIEVEKPFPQEQELNDKLTRLAELNSLLDMDENLYRCGVRRISQHGSLL